MHGGMDSDMDDDGRSGGFKQFAIMVLILLLVIVAIVVTVAWISGDGGLLPFDYEGA